MKSLVLIAICAVLMFGTDAALAGGKPIIREQGHSQPPRIPTPPIHPQRKPVIR